MKCSICLPLRTDVRDALTVINGQAVCRDHIPYVHHLPGGERDPYDEAVVLARLNEMRRPGGQ